VVVFHNIFLLWIFFIGFFLFWNRVSFAAVTVELEQRFICQSLFFVDEEINDEENNYQQNDADYKNS
jgi:hypothetical protein